MSAKIAAIVIPLGYVSDEDFAKDCGFELADDTVTIPRAEYEALRAAATNSDEIDDIRLDELDHLAQENERLLQSLNISHELELRERIRELEGGYLATLSRCDQLISAAEEQRDAIRAETIEECAQVIQEDFDRPDMAEATRAQVQENAGLKTIAGRRWEIANSRIHELEAERDAARINLRSVLLRAEKIEAERDQANEALSNIGLNWNALKEGSAMQLGAIRAKTIEELEPYLSHGKYCAALNPLIKRDCDCGLETIRALAHASTPFDKGSGAQQDESKTKSGK